MADRRPKAMLLVYCAVMMTGLMALISLAVDWGRVQTAKQEMENATDAAARYAASGVGDGTAVAKAQAAAAQNKIDGTPLILQTSDIDVGTWDSTQKSFTVGGSSPNAVRIRAQRSASRGNAVPLVFARLFGRSSCDVTFTSIVTAPPSPKCDLVGLNSVTLTVSGKIQRLSSESGTVIVAGNGTYSLSYGQYIYGDVWYRGAAPNPPQGCITGTKTLLGSDISYPTPITPAGCTNLGAVSYGNGMTYTVPAGNYSATSITVGGGCVMNLTGDVNMYCSGNVTIGDGATINTSGTAYKLTIYQTAAGTIDLNMSSTIYARLYAPLSSVILEGSTPFVGSFVGKDVNITGSAVCSFSSALPIPIAGRGGGSGNVSNNIAIVK